MFKKHLLLVIDAQKGIDETMYWGGNRNNTGAEDKIVKLLHAFRKLKLPVIHIQHCSTEPTSPLRPNQTGHSFKLGCEPEKGETIIQKTTTSAFVNTNLEDQLKAHQADKIVIVGFVTNNSVEATARMSGDLGYDTIIVSDATATFDKIGIDGTFYPSSLMHTISLSNLKGEYAAIIKTQTLIDQLKSSKKLKQ